ncbi:MAG: signal peptidase II [Candidatus Moraniibacteriota bacterium]
MPKIEKKYILSIAFIFLALTDQLIKYFVRQAGVFYVCNKGIAFSLPVSWWIIYAVFFIFFVLVGLYIFDKIRFKELELDKIGLTLIAGGALGNLIDRLNHGCVTDFIRLGFFPVFNLADILIFVGAMIIIFKSHKK